MACHRCGNPQTYHGICGRCESDDMRMRSLQKQQQEYMNQQMGYMRAYGPGQVYMMKAPFSHGVHVVLDILSCGVWIPVHLLCWLLH